MNILDQPLGDIARRIAGATAIFHNHQLDFCCGGNKTLREAANQRQLDAEAIAAQLNQLQTPEATGDDWAEASNEALIEHILTHYHDRHRQQLPELIRLARRVERVHNRHPECPSGLAYHLEQMLEALGEHMRKEEQILFPMITNGMRGAASQPIALMRSQHEEHGEALATIQRITREVTLPEGACNTWRALYLGLENLKFELMEHIHLENNILFNRIDGQLGDARHG